MDLSSTLWMGKINKYISEKTIRQIFKSQSK